MTESSIMTAQEYCPLFLGAFAKLGKSTISFTSVCLSVCPRETRLPLDGLLRNLISDIFSTTRREYSSFKIVVLLYVLFVSYRSMYCLCVNVYCTSATG